ncbi:MAG: ABC transporter permease [Rhodothermales bacterium]
MIEVLSSNFVVAVEAIAHNKTRSILTSLGIIFGVASVIAMLAIGKGAQLEIMSQIRLLGANNIIITPVVEQTEGKVEESTGSSAGAEEKKPYSPGLTMEDAASIVAVIPDVASVSPETVVETTAIQSGYRRSTKLVGVTESYFDGSDFEVESGRLFSEQHIELSAPVCVIGADVVTKFFPNQQPIGQELKVGDLWLTVVGVLKKRNISDKNIERLGLRNFDLDIYTPISTMLLRFEDRSRLTADDLTRAAMNQNSGNSNNAAVNYHQLDRLVVRVDGSHRVRPVADVITRMLQRRHNGVVDFEVTVPEALLKQERRTQTIFNIVLASIASISLIVGGIGIMNIMLASVMERIREIGVRRSVGATERDIIYQFLIEAITISITGGLIGVILGVLISEGISLFADIGTAVSVPSIFIAFFVSVAIGLIFGLWPARKAALQDPVFALRHE